MQCSDDNHFELRPAYLGSSQGILTIPCYTDIYSEHIYAIPLVLSYIFQCFLAERTGDKQWSRQCKLMKSESLICTYNAFRNRYTIVRLRRR